MVMPRLYRGGGSGAERSTLVAKRSFKFHDSTLGCRLYGTRVQIGEGSFPVDAV
jgi:hypothetical protein